MHAHGLCLSQFQETRSTRNEVQSPRMFALCMHQHRPLSQCDGILPETQSGTQDSIRYVTD